MQHESRAEDLNAGRADARGRAADATSGSAAVPDPGDRSRAVAADRARAAAEGMRDLEILARWLDSRFRIPGTPIRFGLDSVLGLVPGVGDAATTVPAAYILLRAYRMGVPQTVLVRMGWNVGLDLLLGSIPVVGDLFDLGFKANLRNIELLRQHFGEPRRTELRDPVQGSI